MRLSPKLRGECLRWPSMYWTGALSITWLNLNPRMDLWSYSWYGVRWNYSSIPKLRRCNRGRLGMDKWFHPTLYNWCNYLFMLGCHVITAQLDIWHITVQRHDDVIKWKHFPRYWPFVRGIHRPPVNSPHKGQWRGPLMLSLICVWINGWVNNREAGDLRRYRAHYDFTVMAIGGRNSADGNNIHLYKTIWFPLAWYYFCGLQDVSRNGRWDLVP